MTRRLLSPDLVWPLSREVDGALASVAEQVTISWASWHREGSEQLLEAEWVPTGGGAIGARPGRGAALWIRPVRGPWAGAAQVAALEALGEAAEWLREAIAAGDPWKASRHSRIWTVSQVGA